MKYFILFVFFICLSFAESDAQVNLSNGLEAYLPFNGNANDASGNGNNGLPQNGIQLTSDRFGNPNSAYLFDGINDYISLTDPTGRFSTLPFSTVIWFQTQSTNFQAIIGKRDFGSNNGQQFQVSIFRPVGAGLFSSVTYNTIPCSGTLTNSVLSMTNYPDTYCLEKWHCIIVTYDGSIHKMFFDGKLVSQNTPAFNSILQCNSDIRLGNWWSGDPLWFKGKLDDFRWYRRVITNDEIAVLSQQVNTEGIDFTYSQDFCKPLKLNFQNYSSSVTYNWNFDDLNAQASIANPEYTFSKPGTFNVRLITSKGLGCKDTIIKPIEIRSLPSNLILNTDTLICSGDSLKIRSVAGNDFCLATNLGTITPGLPDQYVKPQARTTYTMRASILNPNLITNGNFENGNSGFTSNYVFANNRTDNGQYGIVSNARQWYPSLTCTNCGDHSNGNNGNMLIADGSIITGNKLWNSNVIVTPNTTYQISFWAIAYDALETPQLAIFINDNKGGEWTSTTTEVGSWKQYNILWNSGSAASLNLYLSNANIAANNNRFSIDDIVVSRYESGVDSFIVDIKPGLPILASDDAAICQGANTTLSVSGASNYSWTPTTGLSDPGSANPVASPLVTTRYTVRSENTGSCGGTDSVLITVNPGPNLIVSRDTSICAGGSVQLFVSGGNSYLWSPSAGLSNTSISDPIAKPDLTTTYTVVSKGVNGCDASEEIKVFVSSKGRVFIPNAFTPNGDGLNDCFGIHGSQGAQSFELAIYNRFGERVFYANDPNSCWNGIFKGNPQPSGTFVYYLKMQSACGLVNEKGTISLLR
jgi:gliding motility-associated-like protein